MSALQDFALYCFPVLVALGGWLYARHLRMLAPRRSSRRYEGPYDP